MMSKQTSGKLFSTHSCSLGVSKSKLDEQINKNVSNPLTKEKLYQKICVFIWLIQ